MTRSATKQFCILIALVLAISPIPSAFASNADSSKYTPALERPVDSSINETINSSDNTDNENSLENETTSENESPDSKQDIPSDSPTDNNEPAAPEETVDPYTPSTPTTEQTTTENKTEETNITTPLPAGKYLIMPSSSHSRVLDISNNSFENGANAQIWLSNMSGAQTFDISFDNQGFYTFTNTSSGKALDVAWGSKEQGANVHQYEPNGSLAQKWVLKQNEDGTFTIESALAENLVLDIAGAADANGANVQIWTLNNSSAQHFRFLNTTPTVSGEQVVDDGIYIIKGAASGKVLDIASASVDNGAQVQLYTPNNTFAQFFQVTYCEDGFYSIKALHSGKALDIASGNIVPGAKAQQWEFNPTNKNQKWAITPNGNGSYTLLCKANGLALGAEGEGVSNGTTVRTYTPGDSLSQSWSLQPVRNLLSDGYYTIKSCLNGVRSLDVAGGSTSNSANIQIWQWNETPAQRWRLVNNENGSFTLESLCSGLLLTQYGTNVIQANISTNNPESQQWNAIPSSIGGICLINKASGLALDISGAGDWNGNNVGVYQKNDTLAQSFKPQAINAAGNGTYLLRAKSDNRVLDVSEGSRTNGANVQVWSANNTGAQVWNISNTDGDSFSIQNARSKKALDIAEKGTAPGTNVQQWEYAGGSNQKWKISYAGNGYFTITSSASNLCLDISGGGGYDGANVWVQTPNNSDAQLFRLEPTSYTPPASGSIKRSDGSWDWYNNEGDIDRNGAINKVLNTARSLLGVPYVWLGVYPQDGGMDCASFTWYLYKQLGIDIGFETYDQMYSGYRVNSLSEAKPGDIILMYYGGWPNYNPYLPEHVVLYAGNGMIYEEPTFGGCCQFVSLASKGATKIDIRRIMGD